MKNSCPSRASTALPKSVLENPALTLDKPEWEPVPYRFVDLRANFEVITTFGPYEPDVWQMASQLLQAFGHSYTDRCGPIGIDCEMISARKHHALKLSGDPIWFTLSVMFYKPGEVARWEVVPFEILEVWEGISATFIHPSRMYSGLPFSSSSKLP
jgi:hypothetical protein